MAKRERKVSKKEAKKIEKKEVVKAAGDYELAKKFRNRQRTLAFSSRGATHRHRHLLADLRTLMPHSKTDVKLSMDKKEGMAVINEVCEMKSCNNCVFFEVRKSQDLYMWVSKAPAGPSIKFFVTNIHTMDELRLTGNCLKGSRFFLTFCGSFDTVPHLSLIREVLVQTLGVPRGHLKSKPFIDHALSFYYLDGRIWMRHYQIVDKRDDPTRTDDTLLVEIGPRMVLQVVRIFGGSFGGPTIYQNADFMTPANAKRLAKKAKGDSYNDRKASKKAMDERFGNTDLPDTEYDDVFANPDQDSDVEFEEREREERESDDDDDDDDDGEDDGDDDEEDDDEDDE